MTGGKGTSPAYRTPTVPGWIRPQLISSSSAPDGVQWLHEVKFDDYRMHVRLDRGDVKGADPHRSRLDAQTPGGDRQAVAALDDAAVGL